MSLAVPLKQKLRVLQVVPFYRPAHRYGGPVQSVHGLARGLANLDVDVTVFTTNIDGPGNLDVPLESEVVIDGVGVWYFPIESPRSWFRASRLARMLKQRVHQFDLVHVHGLFLYPTLVSATLCRRSGVPYVLAPRGMLDPNAIRAKGTTRKRLYLALLEGRNLRHAASLHYTSAEERVLAAEMGIRTRAFVVPNGLELAAFPDAQCGQQDGAVSDPTVLFLGRIAPKKGLDLLIPAIARTVAERPDARLILAGPDNDGYLSTVMELIRLHGIQDSVRYVGMLTGQDKLDALRDAALLVLPSYSENFGMVVIEALACQTPVVVSDRVNIWTKVAEAGAGLVTSCDSTSLANAMLEMLGDPSRMQEMGKQGRRLVEREFTWAGLARDMLDAYLNILEDPEAERNSGLSGSSH